jgi:hypothetical protein
MVHLIGNVFPQIRILFRKRPLTGLTGTQHAKDEFAPARF